MRRFACIVLLVASRASAQSAQQAVDDSPPPAPLVVRPPSEVAPVRTGRPPLSAGRIAGELAVSAAIGTAGFFGGALLGAGIDKSNSSCSTDLCGFGGAVIGGYLGGSIGVGIGVYLIGNIGDETGSTGAAIGGGFVGGLVALGVGEAVGKTTHNDGLGWIVGASAWPATAIVFFNLSRRWKPGPVTTGSLIRYDHGRARLGIPVVVRSNDMTGLSLASGSF